MFGHFTQEIQGPGTFLWNEFACDGYLGEWLKFSNMILAECNLASE